jgi:hypothetical protein
MANLLWFSYLKPVSSGTVETGLNWRWQEVIARLGMSQHMAADETSPQQNLRGRPATVGDVAKLAGVAKATAARALGGYGAVSPAVLQRVEVAAQALD